MTSDLGPFGVEDNIDEIIAFFEYLESLFIPQSANEPSEERLDDSLDLDAQSV